MAVFARCIPCIHGLRKCNFIAAVAQRATSGTVIAFAAICDIDQDVFFSVIKVCVTIIIIDLFVSALTSQFISNVPAAILLSRFTQDYQGLLIGVNVGGAGTLIASLASLITFREFAKHKPAQTGRFLLLFLAVSFGFLAVLLGAMSLLGQA